MIKNQRNYQIPEDSDVERIIRAKIGPCVSIVLQLQTELNQRKQNPEIVKQALRQAKSSLENYKASPEILAAVTESVEEVLKSVNLEEPFMGLGVFVSPDIASVFWLPFAVNEIVLVADSFESRDLLYLRQHFTPYYVLSLTKTHIRLFRARADSLVEIRDGVFPAEYKDDFEYARSTRGSSFGYGMKGFEKDKSVLTEVRAKSFVRETIHGLAPYLTDPGIELIVAGPQRLVTDFGKEFPGRNRVSGVTTGNTSGSHFEDFVSSAWQACQATRKEKLLELIEELDNLGLNFKATGLREVWEAAGKGKGHVLLVERDFQRRGYLPAGASQIRLHPPKGEYVGVDDAVDDVIEKVIHTGGTVFITEPGQLSKFESIGLILRYR